MLAKLKNLLNVWRAECLFKHRSVDKSQLPSQQEKLIWGHTCIDDSNRPPRRPCVSCSEQEAKGAGVLMHIWRPPVSLLHAPAHGWPLLVLHTGGHERLDNFGGRGGLKPPNHKKARASAGELRGNMAFLYSGGREWSHKIMSSFYDGPLK